MATDWTGDNRFVTRVECELRRRRDDAVDRCMACGRKVQRSEDYVHARGGVVHTSCPAADLETTSRLGAEFYNTGGAAQWTRDRAIDQSPGHADKD